MPPKKKSKAAGRAADATAADAATAAAAVPVADESTGAAAAAAAAPSTGAGAAAAAAAGASAQLQLTAGGVDALRLLARHRPHRAGMPAIGMAAGGAAMPPPPPPAPVTMQIVDIRRCQSMGLSAAAPAAAVRGPQPAARQPEATFRQLETHSRVALAFSGDRCTLCLTGCPSQISSTTASGRWWACHCRRCPWRPARCRWERRSRMQPQPLPKGTATPWMSGWVRAWPLVLRQVRRRPVAQQQQQHRHRQVPPPFLLSTISRTCTWPTTYC